MRARRRGGLKQRRTLPLLSLVSKQMSARLFSLLRYKGLLTNTHAQACAHFFLGKSMHSGFCNFPRCFAVPPSSEQGDKGSRGGEKLLLSALRFMARVCFHFFLSFILSSNCSTSSIMTGVCTLRRNTVSAKSTPLSFL